MPIWSRAHAGSLWSADRGPLPRLVAHRGASAKAPENSLEAFAQARHDGADGVELDVLACASGEVVVFHDDDLLRLGGRAEAVRSVAWSRLRGWKLLSGATIPLLSEVLAATAPMLVNVELKPDGRSPRGLRELVHRVAAIVEAEGATSRVLISSFHPWAVALWQWHCPAVPAALLYEADAARPLREAWSLSVLRPFAAHPEARLCQAPHLARLRAQGLRTHVWTVDEPTELRRLQALGVDGLICNDPAAARAVLSSSAAPAE